MLEVNDEHYFVSFVWGDYADFVFKLLVEHVSTNILNNHKQCSIDDFASWALFMQIL